MPLANRGAASSTPLGGTTSRGLVEPSQKDGLEKRRPGPADYNTMKITCAFQPLPINAPRTMFKSQSMPALKRRPVWKQSPAAKEKMAFMTAEERFGWMNPPPIPGVGSYDGSLTTKTLTKTLEERDAYAAKTLSQFGEAPRTSAFEVASSNPGPGNYNPFPSVTSAGEDIRARSAPFLSSQTVRFNRKLRYDGVETPAPHDYGIRPKWQYEDIRRPSNNSHQHCFKQRATGSSLSDTIAVGRPPLVVPTTTAKLQKLGPGTFDVTHYSIDHKAKQTRAPLSSSSFASTSMRFGSGPAAYGPQINKRLKWMSKLKHTEIVGTIKKGEPMFGNKKKTRV